jgi:hypothetical protein
MSSPRRAAKARERTADKAGAKPAAKARPVASRPAKPRPAALRPAKPNVAVANGASADAKRLAATLQRSIVDGNLDLVAADALQAVIAAACRVYTARREAGEDIAPVAKNSISATDVMVTASGLLQAADLAVFELGMWQNWTGR